MLERIHQSEVPFDWMFIMFGVTMVVTGLCTGVPYAGLMWSGEPAEATVERIEPSLEEVPAAADPREAKSKQPREGKTGRDGARKRTASGARFAHLRFEISERAQRLKREAMTPENEEPIDGGGLRVPSSRLDGVHSTRLKIPPGAVSDFEAARVDGEPVHILYRPSDPDYLMRREDLYRLQSAAGITIAGGLLFFLLAGVIRWTDDSDDSGD